MVREIDIPGQGNRTLSDVLSMAEEYPMGSVSGELFRYLARRFQEPVSCSELYVGATGVLQTNGWEYNHWNAVCRFRKVLPENLSLYSIRGWGQYLLDRRRPIGFQFVPSDRSRMISQCSEEARPFLEFCSEVKVRDSLNLKSRLTPTEYSLMRSLGLSYPELVASQTLIRSTWGPHATLDDSLETLRTAVSRLRRKVKNFQGFGIVTEGKVGYRLFPI